jgi:beta-lactamase superfamily II metal-dependent hydrolase
MSFPELIILDVGHGNCALLRDKEGVTLIDCPPGSILFELLESLEITKISNIIISHADQDHIAGLPQLLLSTKVENIHLNSDWIRETQNWREICSALKDARKHAGVKIETSLTTATTGRHNVGEVSVEILAPTPELALVGVGGKDLLGSKLTANSMSAVVSLSHGDRKVAILAGDLDQVGLNNLIQEGSCLKHDILVFPHHGGRPGQGVDGKEFARQLCEKIKPKCVIFSIDRSRHNNPRDEIIEGVLSAVPDVHIVCTQLSRKCAKNLPEEEPMHLTNLPARGRIEKKCCGGTIRLIFGEDSDTYIPSPESHQDFISRYPESICRQFLPEQEGY